MVQDCHQLLRITPLHLNISVLPSQPSGQRSSDWRNWNWGSVFSPPPFPSEAPPQTEGSDQGTFDTFRPTLALNSDIKPYLASASGPRLVPSVTQPQPAMDQAPRRTTWAPSPHLQLLGRLGGEHPWVSCTRDLGAPRDLTVLGSEGRKLPGSVGPEHGLLRSAQMPVPLPSWLLLQMLILP